MLILLTKKNNFDKANVLILLIKLVNLIVIQK